MSDILDWFAAKSEVRNRNERTWHHSSQDWHKASLKKHTGNNLKTGAVYMRIMTRNVKEDIELHELRVRMFESDPAVVLGMVPIKAAWRIRRKTIRPLSRRRRTLRRRSCAPKPHFAIHEVELPLLKLLLFLLQPPVSHVLVS